MFACLSVTRSLLHSYFLFTRSDHSDEEEKKHRMEATSFCRSKLAPVSKYGADVLVCYAWCMECISMYTARLTIGIYFSSRSVFASVAVPVYCRSVCHFVELALSEWAQNSTELHTTPTLTPEYYFGCFLWHFHSAFYLASSLLQPSCVTVISRSCSNILYFLAFLLPCFLACISACLV